MLGHQRFKNLTGSLHSVVSRVRDVSTVVPLMLLLQPFSAAAQELAKLYSKSGTVEIRQGSSTTWNAAPDSTAFAQGDALRTGAASKAAYIDKEGILVRVNAQSVIEFGGAGVQVASGDAYFLSKDPHEVPKVTTSLVSGSVRGTEFAVSVRPDVVTFSVIQGEVKLENPLGAVVLNSGEEGITEKGKAPVKRIMVKPFDAVQWGLRYPALVSIADYKTTLEERSISYAAVHSAFARFDVSLLSSHDSAFPAEQKRVKAALMALVGQTPPPSLTRQEILQTTDPLYLLLTAARLLESGDVSQAKEIHARLSSMGLSPELEAALLSQQATVAVITNEKQVAQELSQKALARNPTSAQAKFARSLFLQSEGAIAEAVEVISHESDENPFMLARQAELLFGSGKPEQAEKLVTQALALNPADADALSVKGFIFLARNKIQEAKEIFSTALRSPTPPTSAHLGSGIALFREGDELAGRVAIQKAVHLEPTNSLYRSYLAKALFESDRYDVAEEEIDNARRLDPFDPTPELYDAFAKLATFRPVAALEAVEESIAKNDNRFVYRSKLLLDQDRATRGVGLGRVFSALDFFVPMRVAAQRSLAIDPTNYSAHLLLKDALTGDPSADTAVVVQDSTASLLAPSTFSSILATASGGASLNDYTTLFEQEQSRTIVDLIGESKERGFDSSIAHFYGGEDHSILVKYGATVKRGFRDNDYTKNHIGRVMGAYDLTADDKLLVDSTFTALDRGDTLLGFNPLINDPDLEIDADEFMGRLGYRHTFDSAQHLLAQVSYVDLNQNFSDDASVRPLQVEVTNGNELLQQGEGSVPFRSRDAFGTRGFLGDMQHLLDREYFSLVSGVGFVSLRQNQSNTATDAPAEFELPSDFSLLSRSDTTPSATRGYSYATLKPAPWLSLTGGANYSSLNRAESEGAPLTGGEQNIDKLSPRVGMLLSPSSSLTVRSAYFHRIGGASARDFDNLEPTQISGIRTVFTDLPGVESENFGAGVDWKIPKSTYMGVEYLARRFNEPFTSGLDVAQFDISGTLDTRVDPSSTRFYSGEQIVTGYLQQVLTPQLVSSLEHSWSLREDDISDINVATHKTRLGLNYFHPSGFYSFGSGTWRHQTRDNFEEAGSEGVTSFWVFSAGAGWQLPNRHGAIQLAVRNIFDETFQYEQPTSDLSVLPGTDVQLALNLNF